MLIIRCKSKTSETFYRITLDEDNFTMECNCAGFDGKICSHIDATMVAGERHMILKEDRHIADKAMIIMDGRIEIPSYWMGSWRRNKVWRGLSRPGSKSGMIKQYGEDYTERPKMCFTGAGPKPKTRDGFLEEARHRGWQAVDSVQKGITLVVTSDPTAKTKKLKQARRDGIPIISYTEWEELHDAD